MSNPKSIQFEGQAGVIDCALDWPQQEPRGWALVLHPLPIEGGSRDNKVVTTISRACADLGLLAVRPNFRGVGQSAGSFDAARGETHDMHALVTQFYTHFPQFEGHPWALAGFSFGTAVAAQLYALLAQARQPTPQALLLAGTAVERFRHLQVSVPEFTYLVHGADDEIVPLSEAMAFARQQDLAVTVIPDCTHFFHGKLILLRQLISDQIHLMAHRPITPGSHISST
ncbi:MAG TPA: alpha/beta hydrolase [Paenalcaligenes sp.]|nr:alpha/beta hydrolase [Paenalcaligenes sp.]